MLVKPRPRHTRERRASTASVILTRANVILPVEADQSAFPNMQHAARSTCDRNNRPGRFDRPAEAKQTELLTCPPHAQEIAGCHGGRCISMPHFYLRARTMMLRCLSRHQTRGSQLRRQFEPCPSRRGQSKASLRDETCFGSHGLSISPQRKTKMSKQPQVPRGMTPGC